MNIEKRFNNQPQFRAIEEGDQRYLEGYAILFDVRSQLLFSWEKKSLFYEVIEKNALDEVLKSPDLSVTFNFQHNDNFLISRSENGSLQIKVDEKGLWFRSEVPSTSYADDIYELVKRGTLNQNSFAFYASPENYRWDDSSEYPIGYLSKIDMLQDLSVVVRAAYKETSIDARSEVATRSFQEYLDKKSNDEHLAIKTPQRYDNKYYVAQVTLLKNKIK